MSSPKRDDKLISVRATLVLTLALLAAVVAGVLTYLQSNSVTTALIGAGGCWAGAVLLFNAIIETR